MIPGAYVVTRYATRGEQLARIMPVRYYAENIKVLRYRKSSQKWTRAVYLPPGLILRQASVDDIKRLGPVAKAKENI